MPNSLRLAALALGATRWQMVRDHVLPVGLARHPDRHDPRPVAGPSARRRRCSWSARRARSCDLPARAVRSLHRLAGRDLQLRQGTEHRVPDRGRRGHPDPPGPPADDERRGHRDPEPVHGRIIGLRTRGPCAASRAPSMSVSETRAERPPGSAPTRAARPHRSATDPVVLSAAACRSGTARRWP